MGKYCQSVVQEGDSRNPEGFDCWVFTIVIFASLFFGHLLKEIVGIIDQITNLKA